MRNKLKIDGYIFLIIGLLCLPTLGFGQDLGSSNDLFKSPNPKTKTETKKAAPKKAAPQRTTPKPVAKRRAVAPKPAKTAVNPPPANQTETNADVQQTAVKDNPPPIVPPKNNLVITVGDKSTGDFNEFYEKAIEEGNTARDNRNYGKAEAAYLRAQSLKNGDARAIYGLGNLYSDQQRWEEAEQAYRTAIQLDPTMAEANIALSFVLTQPIAGANLPDRYVEAERAARTAIQLDAANAFAYDQLGVALELRGMIADETQNAYRRAITLEPAFALAYAHLGRLLRKKGLVNESADAYRSAIQNANDVATMVLVADVMQSQQKYVESEQLLRRALREDEKNPTALFLLGRALTTRGSFEEAEKILKKSALVSPNSFVSYRLLGSLFVRREKFDDAEKYLLKALDMVSPNEKKGLAQDFETVGDGYLKLGKNKDAARVYRQAAALDANRVTLSDKINKAQAKN